MVRRGAILKKCEKQMKVGKVRVDIYIILIELGEMKNEVSKLIKEEQKMSSE